MVHIELNGAPQASPSPSTAATTTSTSETTPRQEVETDPKMEPEAKRVKLSPQSETTALLELLRSPPISKCLFQFLEVKDRIKLFKTCRTARDTVLKPLLKYEQSHRGKKAPLELRFIRKECPWLEEITAPFAPSLVSQFRNLKSVNITLSKGEKFVKKILLGNPDLQHLYIDSWETIEFFSWSLRNNYIRSPSDLENALGDNVCLRNLNLLDLSKVYSCNTGIWFSPKLYNTLVELRLPEAFIPVVYIIGSRNSRIWVQQFLSPLTEFLPHCRALKVLSFQDFIGGDVPSDLAKAILDLPLLEELGCGEASLNFLENILYPLLATRTQFRFKIGTPPPLVRNCPGTIGITLTSNPNFFFDFPAFSRVSSLYATIKSGTNPDVINQLVDLVNHDLPNLRVFFLTFSFKSDLVLHIDRKLGIFGSHTIGTKITVGDMVKESIEELILEKQAMNFIPVTGFSRLTVLDVRKLEGSSEDFDAIRNSVDPKVLVRYPKNTVQRFLGF